MAKAGDGGHRVSKSVISGGGGALGGLGEGEAAGLYRPGAVLPSPVSKGAESISVAPPAGTSVRQVP